jgi:ATP-binding cassette, subfamily B, bacterial
LPRFVPATVTELSRVQLLAGLPGEKLGEIARHMQPGDYFGEVGLAMQIPRTASVRALTPAVVASCDRESFDRLLRPLFADDK